MLKGAFILATLAGAAYGNQRILQSTDPRYQTIQDSYWINPSSNQNYKPPTVNYDPYVPVQNQAWQLDPRQDVPTQYTSAQSPPSSEYRSGNTYTDPQTIPQQYQPQLRSSWNSNDGGSSSFQSYPSNNPNFNNQQNWQYPASGTSVSPPDDVPQAYNTSPSPSPPTPQSWQSSSTWQSSPSGWQVPSSSSAWQTPQSNTWQVPSSNSWQSPQPSSSTSYPNPPSNSWQAPQSQSTPSWQAPAPKLVLSSTATPFTNIDLIYGSNTGASAKIQNNKDCPRPRLYLGGICKCPNDGVFVAGNCLPKGSTPPSNCQYPRKIINGECLCPQGRIYTSGNSCVPIDTTPSSNTNNGNYDNCWLPRVRTVNGFCLCPNNGDYSGGKCYASSFGPEYQPYYNNRDVDSIASLGKFFREFDGTNNNRQNPDWGSKGSILQRRCAANYNDKINQPKVNLPNPRTLSNELADLGLEQIVKNRNKVTSATTFWGQFVDHDLDLTQSGSNQRMDIQIPYDDKFFKNQPMMGFVRSGYVMKDARMHRNMITAWIDGSQVYGSDEQTCKSLRLFADGKLKTSVDNMLPREPTMGLFQAGDIRANENIMLSSYHTIFMREHNRVCDQIKQIHPQMNDQAIFRSARQWVIGLLQKITMEEFVPLLIGDQYDRIIGQYNGYKAYVNPNIPTQFATAAFRVGHSLLVNQYTFINKDGVSYQNTHLNDLFLNPNYINSDKIQDAIRGLSRTLAKQKSIKLSDQVRNLLILDPSSRQTRMDLFSLNIQRGRDHGLPSYNQARAAYGLKKVLKFQDIEPDMQKASKLNKIYNNKLNDVQLFVGILSEEPVKNAILGELGCQIVGQAFRNLRDGDRFWYQGAYPASVVQKIKGTTLSDVIRRNTKIGKQLQDDIWHYYEQI